MIFWIIILQGRVDNANIFKFIHFNSCSIDVMNRGGTIVIRVIHNVNVAIYTIYIYIKVVVIVIHIVMAIVLWTGYSRMW